MKIKLRAEGFGKTESAGFNAMAEMWEATSGEGTMADLDRFVDCVENLNKALAALVQMGVPFPAVAAFVEKWSVAVPAHGKDSQ